MIQHIVWTITFIFLWLTLFWINYLHSTTPTRTKKHQPPVTIAIPAYNEQNTIQKTLTSLKQLNYPKNNIHIIIVDDGSTDKTTTECQKYIKNNPDQNITLINQPNRGKATAINAAIQKTTTPYFAVLDADTRVTPNSLNALINTITDKQTASAISVVKVDTPKNLYEKIQKVEYMLSNLFRKLMGTTDTLFLTHGGFCIFNTAVLKKIDGFANDNGNTEDLEIGMRLRSQNHKITMAWNAITYTKVPTTFKTLWRQRIRWYRGFLYNHHKYIHLLFNPAHKHFGLFQIPINILSIILLLTTIILASYESISNTIEFTYRSLTINTYFLNNIIDIPTLKELILSQNTQISLPIIISTLLSIHLIITAFKQLNEKITPSILHIPLYLLIAPTLTGIHWLTAIAQETIQTKRKWR